MSQIIENESLPESLIKALGHAEKIAVLSGAGVSAESGIPTFREAQTGLWARHDPMELASPQGFEDNPELVWRWYQWRRELVDRAVPNAGHRALARLQSLRRTTLITQNVDGLHQQAGSDRVLELHGSLQRNICSVTRKAIDSAWISRQIDEPPPSPHHRQGLTRPDVVWFGESLDADILERSIEAAQSCDLMLVVGTSSLVHPAAQLPRLASNHHARLLEINPNPTPLTDCADWYWPAPSALALPKLLETL